MTRSAVPLLAGVVLCLTATAASAHHFCCQSVQYARVPIINGTPVVIGGGSLPAVNSFSTFGNSSGIVPANSAFAFNTFSTPQNFSTFQLQPLNALPAFNTFSAPQTFNTFSVPQNFNTFQPQPMMTLSILPVTNPGISPVAGNDPAAGLGQILAPFLIKAILGELTGGGLGGGSILRPAGTGCATSEQVAKLLNDRLDKTDAKIEAISTKLDNISKTLKVIADKEKIPGSTSRSTPKFEQSLESTSRVLAELAAKPAVPSAPVDSAVAARAK